jgi:hypothetical protein
VSSRILKWLGKQFCIVLPEESDSLRKSLNINAIGRFSGVQLTLAHINESTSSFNIPDTRTRIKSTAFLLFDRPKRFECSAQHC